MAHQKRLQYKPQLLTSICTQNLLTWRKTQQQQSRQTRPRQYSSTGLAHHQYLYDTPCNLHKDVHSCWKWNAMILSNLIKLH